MANNNIVVLFKKFLSQLSNEYELNKQKNYGTIVPLLRATTNIHTLKVTPKNLTTAPRPL